MDEDDDVASRHPSRQSRFKELDSPLRSQASIVGTIQGGHTEKRPPGPPGRKGDHASMIPEGKATLKPRSDPMLPMFSILKSLDFSRKGAIREVGPVQGQYVSSYFAVPKSKRVPDKWRPILNLNKFNK